MEWLAILIPIVFWVYIYNKYKREIIWWEFIIPFAISIILILLIKFLGQSTVVSDTEYWGGYATKTTYYETWDEWIEDICPRDIPTGTDVNGNTTYTTVLEDCSYNKTHHAYYTLNENLGNERVINQKQYFSLKKLFNNSHFVELNRNYNHIDGDKYVSNYDGSYEKFKFIASEHSYENKVQAADTELSYNEISDEEINKYSLYSYPEITDFYELPTILKPKNYYFQKGIDKKFDWLNGKLGKKKQLRVWVLLFDDKSREAGTLQEALWKGGNKNEFVVTIGVDKQERVKWCHVFSWTDVRELKFETKEFVEKMDLLNLNNLADYLYENLDNKFVRKSFSEFSHLSVKPPLWSIITIYLLTLLSNIVISFWIVKNDIN